MPRIAKGAKPARKTARGRRAAEEEQPKRRGRPPGSGRRAAAEEEQPKRRGRPPGSSKTKDGLGKIAKAKSERMTRRAAAQDKPTKPSVSVPKSGYRVTVMTNAVTQLNGTIVDETSDSVVVRYKTGKTTRERVVMKTDLVMKTPESVFVKGQGIVTEFHAGSYKEKDGKLVFSTEDGSVMVNRVAVDVRVERLAVSDDDSSESDDGEEELVEVEDEEDEEEESTPKTKKKKSKKNEPEDEEESDDESEDGEDSEESEDDDSEDGEDESEEEDVESEDDESEDGEDESEEDESEEDESEEDEEEEETPKKKTKASAKKKTKKSKNDEEDEDEDDAEDSPWEFDDN